MTQILTIISFDRVYINETECKKYDEERGIKAL